MTSRQLLVIAAISLALGACGGKSEQPAPVTTAAQPAGEGTTTAAPAVAPSPDSATVSGSVKIEGPIPQMPLVQVSGDAVCEDAHKGALKSEEIVAGSNGELANVLVYVKDYHGPIPAPPSSPVILDQKGCQYHPHVLAAMVGQVVEFRNGDPTFHNVHGLAKTNEAFNDAQPGEGMVNKRAFDKPEMAMHIKCDVHSWMSAWLSVLPHPYFSVSRDNGSFSIQGLPPGTYTIEAWHEKLGTQSQQITVGPKESKEISFSFKT